MVVPSFLFWSSPVVFVLKKDGSTRLCGDYLNANSVTKLISYTLPHLDHALDSLQGTEHFTTLTFLRYSRVPVARKDREKEALIISDGALQPTIILFGLYSAPAILYGSYFNKHL